MKTLAELEKIRKDTLDRINLRKEDKDDAIRVVVMMAFMEEASRRNLSQVHVTQTGCIGMCRFEPMADVVMPGQEKVTYVRLTPEKARKIVAEHIVNGKPVTEYTIGAAEDKANG